MCKLRCLRWSVLLCCVVVFAAGGVTVWGGYELKNFAFMKAFEKYNSDLIGLAVIAMGGLMGLMALIGCCGAWFRIRWCLGIFCSLMCWMGLVLMASGAGALYFQGYMNDHLTRNSCRSVDLLEKGDDSMQSAAAVMCTYLCPCNFDPELQVLYAPFGRTLIKGSAKAISECVPCEGLTNLSPSEQLTVNTYLDAQGLNLASCQSMSNSDFEDLYFTNSQQTLFPLLSWLEYSFNCAGLCTPSAMYTFTDVNNGNPNLPTEACYAPFNDWVDEKFPIFGGLGVAFGAFLLTMAVLSFLLCCCKFV